jgi:dolichol-phosphate mannosyltransferase
VISFPRNFGQHPAIAAGLDHVRGDIVVLMDADLEDRPEHIPSLIRALEDSRCDVVYTTKGNGARPSRDLTSNFYHFIFSRMVGVSLPRQLGTFRIFTRKVADALRQFPERHVLYGPLMFYAGFKHTIVPVDRGDRPGRSSYSFGKRLRLAANSLLTYSDLPPIAFASVGAVMIALPLIYGLLVLAQYMLDGRTLPQGMTLVVLLLCGFSGSLMLAMGVLGLYIFRIFQEVLARPRYLIDETINIGHGSGS